jgi:hypothetical protein
MTGFGSLCFCPLCEQEEDQPVKKTQEVWYIAMASVPASGEVVLEPGFHVQTTLDGMRTSITTWRGSTGDPRPLFILSVPKQVLEPHVKPMKSLGHLVMIVPDVLVGVPVELVEEV